MTPTWFFRFGVTHQNETQPPLDGFLFFMIVHFAGDQNIGTSQSGAADLGRLREHHVRRGVVVNASQILVALEAEGPAIQPDAL